MVAYCCVPGCPETSKTSHLHALPKDKERRKKWCEAIGRIQLLEIEDAKRGNYRFCDSHFSEECKFIAHQNRTNLKATAIPTLNLPVSVLQQPSSDHEYVASSFASEFQQEVTKAPSYKRLASPILSTLEETTPPAKTPRLSYSPVSQSPIYKTTKPLFNEGLDPKVMAVLRDTVEKLHPLDRYCVLLFDELPLEESLTNLQKPNEFADHAAVFMIKGVRKKWKQPISFHFSQGGVKATDLKQILESTIDALQGYGFKVIATVCGQFSAGADAIKQLVTTTEERTGVQRELHLFEINEQKIVAIYDPPHLLKEIRDNFINYDVKYMLNNTEKRAKWSDIQRLYEIDVGDINTRVCNKLTDAHIYKEKLNKTKVYYAVHVLSHTVSSTMRWTAKHGKEGLLEVTADQTADFMSFMDRLFDSVNGVVYEPDYGKELRCAIKKSSPHFQFWQKAITVLKTVKFCTPEGDVVSSTVTNWIRTLYGFIYISKKLLSEGFKYLPPRNINQDPLENFFACIRSQGGQNMKPTCTDFVSSFKCLIINNFSASHSSISNCEEDDNEALNTLEHFL